MGEVIRFPRRDTEQIDGQVVHVDAERVEASAETSGPGDALVERGRGIPPALAGKAARRVAELALPVGTQAVKFAVLHGYYLAAGAFDTFSAVYARWTGRDIDAQIRAAQAAGEHGVVAELMRQRTENRRLFLERIQVFGQFLVKLPLILGGLAAVVLAITLIVAVVAWARPDGLGFADVWDGLFTALASGFEWTVWAATVPLPVLLIAAAAGVLVKGYNQRRRAQNAPAWMQSETETDGTVDTLDEGSILGALRNLGIKPLNDAFKAGWGTPANPARVWEMGLGKDGRGWRCQIRLPQQVPVSEISRKKHVLAHNLGRLAVEVWTSEPKDKPGVLDLWIADPGVLTGPVDDWPLLAELESAVTDYFAGVPVAVDLRGDEVIGEFAGKNWAVAGMMGSGKSTLVITALLGAMLDPLVDIDVFVMARNSDYKLMEPRLRTLRTGADEATVEACMNTLRELYDELEIRGQALEEHTKAGDPDAEKVTRRLAEKDARLRPRIMVVDECQALFMHEKYGTEAQNKAILLMNASRKYGITLILLTPEPSTDSLPRKLMAVMSNRACFAIGDQQSNDAILGTGAYKRGISAVGLEPKTKHSDGDVGTAMTSSGFLPKPGLIRSYYVPRDQHKAIVERALQLRKAANITTTAPAAEPEKRDLLEDLDDVLGAEKVSAAEAAKALVAAFGRAYYRDGKPLTGAQLVAELADVGVKVPSTANRYHVDPMTVRNALARQSTADLDQ
ncbi:cell division protein FtsK [Saccharopolyspora thermophila]|uniref:Cell division protein FtsK n=2 Tax=Saccharopolyspora thermophila TaxID=89367 RepID=A0ABP3LY69_9PSEU